MKPKVKLPKEQLKFGATTTDHMLVIDWKFDQGWTAPRIVPYQNLELDPASSVFHYALACFEGMKAYKDDKDRIRLFRPDKNMHRINRSAERLNFPSVHPVEFLECIKELIRLDQEWIPKTFGYSLYIRPTYISTYPFIGVTPSKQVKLYCILSPVGPYYPEGFKPVKLYADSRYVRAWPGGTGDVKLAANYAIGLRPTIDAHKRGYAQVLWLFGDECEVTEVGTMNQFFFWKTKSGRRELITAPIEDGVVLHGVTRDSILQLARNWGEFDVIERKYTIFDVISAVEEGRMIEAFGSGTAAIVAPVNGFYFRGKEYPIPMNSKNPEAKAGELTQRLVDTIMGIQYGRIPHEWSVLIS